MKAKILASMFLVAIAAVACSESVSATDPARTGASDTGSGIATRQPATVTRLDSIQPAPTATVVTRVLPAPTRQPISTRQPAPTVAPRPVETVPSPGPVATRQPVATPIRIDRNATPTPLWTPRPLSTVLPAPTATPFIVPTVTGAAEGQFQSLLNYQFNLPPGWSERLTDSSMVLSDPSGKISVTITEQPFERWRYQNIISYGVANFPDRPSGWDVWSNTSAGAIKFNTAWEYQFGGEKNGEQYLNFVHWYAWGDLQVQVSTEVPAFDWNFGPSVRTMVNTVTGSFKPHDETNMLTSEEVLAIMFERMDERPSNIYGRNDALRRRFEFTCRDIYNDMIIEPVYLGGGLWQISAPTSESVESWWVFEPAGSIMSVSSNISRC